MPVEPGSETSQAADVDYDRAALVAEAILAGKLDAGLPLIVTAINSRMATREERRKHEALQRLVHHARVRIGNTAKPQYLRGLTGEIHEIRDDLVVVCLDKPVGRFTDHHISCPPQLLEPIEDR